MKAYFGNSEEAWCSEFASYCAYKAGLVDMDLVPKFTNAADGVKWFKAKGDFHERNSSYTPKKGDIAFFAGRYGPSHTELVIGYSNGEIHTISGNAGGGTNNYKNGKVKKRTYKTSDTYIYGYGHPDFD